MKVVYQTCCGVDVHKSFLVATIIKTTSGVQTSYQKKRFPTFNNSILAFRQWLLGNSCRHVCMESGICSDWGSCLEAIYRADQSAFSESLRDTGIN